MKKNNKKGAELNITIIIVVILAVLALVILVMSFTGGMAELWAQITGIWQQPQGIEEATYVETCNLYVTTNNAYGYCCSEVSIRGRDSEGKITCKDLHRLRGGSGFAPEAENFCDPTVRPYTCPA